MWLAIVQSKVLATVLATVLVKLVVRIDQEAARVISRGKGGGREKEDTVTCSLMLIITPPELQATGSRRGQKEWLEMD